MSKPICPKQKPLNKTHLKKNKEPLHTVADTDSHPFPHSMAFSLRDKPPTCMPRSALTSHTLPTGSTRDRPHHLASFPLNESTVEAKLLTKISAISSPKIGSQKKEINSLVFKKEVIPSLEKKRTRGDLVRKRKRAKTSDPSPKLVSHTPSTLTFLDPRKEAICP